MYINSCCQQKLSLSFPSHIASCKVGHAINILFSQNVNTWTLQSMEGIMFYNKKIVILFLLNKCFTILHCFVENMLSGIDIFLQNKNITSKANSCSIAEILRFNILKFKPFFMSLSKCLRIFLIPKYLGNECCYFNAHLLKFCQLLLIHPVNLHIKLQQGNKLMHPHL